MESNKENIQMAWNEDVDLIKTQTLIDNVKWKQTRHVAYHEYIMEFWPSGDLLYEAINKMLMDYGYDAKFKGFTYRYWNNRGYRYWIFDNLDGTRSYRSAINRTYEDQERT